MPFLFEKLDVYAAALEWVGSAGELLEVDPQVISRPFRDQLIRAALSIPLNIAEGNGRWHAAEKQQFFRIARGSVFECVAILQVLHRKKQLAETPYSQAYAKLETLSKMLSGLISSVSEQKRSAPQTPLSNRLP